MCLLICINYLIEKKTHPFCKQLLLSYLAVPARWLATSILERQELSSLYLLTIMLLKYIDCINSKAISKIKAIRIRRRINKTSRKNTVLP